MAKRRCKGKTKKGKPCKAPPLTARGAAALGLSESDRDHCRAHHPNLPDNARFGSPEQAGRAGASAKPHVPKLREALAARVYDSADEVIEALFAALEADRAIVVGSGESAYVDYSADHSIRLRAISEIFDRAEGRAIQRTEIGTRPDQPLRISHELLTEPDVRDGLAAVKRRVADARAERSVGTGPGGGSPPPGRKRS